MSEVLYLHVAPRGEEAAGPGASYPVLPVGAVGICNRLLAAGVAVEGLNVAVERLLDPSFSLDIWLRGRPASGLVLLDLHWAEHARGVVDAVARVAAAWPQARIAVGGLTATRFSEELLALAPTLDAVLVGDAEGPALALATAVLEGQPWPPLDVPNVLARGDNGQIYLSKAAYRTTLQDYEALNTADLDWLAHADVYRRMLHSRPPRGAGRADLAGHWLANGRGCAFDCDYCGGGRGAHAWLSGLRGLLRRGPEALARDVTRLMGQGVHQIALTLDPDMLGAKHRAPFFAALRGRPGLYVESFQLPSEALLDALAARADLEHTELALTPLSGDRAVRWRNGKHYDDDGLLARLDGAYARDLSAFVFFSLNLPGEDDRTLGHTLALAERLLDRAPPGRLRVANICHTLDPGSPMAEDPAAFGLEGVQFRTLADWVAFGHQPRPWSFTEGERGFSVAGRNLASMVARWDALCAGSGGLAIPVPRV